MLVFHMELLNRRGEPFGVWFQLPHYWSDDLDQWLKEATPSGTARLLCSKVPEDLRTNSDPITMLMVSVQGDADSFGKVVGTATMNDDNVTELDGELIQWLLA
jgi:hypothetical protein